MPVRSGWACRPLCVFLRFRCRVGLCVVAWRAWSGWVRRPLCLHLRLPCGVGLQYVCPRGRCGVAGHVGLSALTCVFPMGTDCIMLECRALCARLCLPCGVELCCACGAGAEWLGTSASLRSLVPLLRGRIAPLVCLIVVYMYVAAAGAAARRASTCSSRRPESVCVRLPRLRPVPLPSPLSLPPPPPPLGCCLLPCVPCLLTRPPRPGSVLRN